MSICWDPTGNCYFVGRWSGQLDSLGGHVVENVSELRAYTRIRAGTGFSTVLPDMDFETYSEAGYTWNPDANKGLGKWQSIVKSPPHGLGAVGAPVYSEHPSTEVLSLAYNFKDGTGPRLWLPGMPPPTDLFAQLAAGHTFEAWNSIFEFLIWENVCVKMGWPQIRIDQLRDAMAKARAFSLPAKLGKAAEVLETSDQKIDDGMRLIKKFSVPRNPTKKDARRRLLMSDPDHAEDGQKFIEYNFGDIKSESAVSAEIPDLDPDELETWKVDQRINTRGVHIDRKALADCIAIVEQAFEKYEAELVTLTGGTVKSASEIDKLLGWLSGRGVSMPNMQAETVEDTLADWNYPDWPGYNEARRALEIRAVLGAASVKKLFAIDRRTSDDGRLRDLFAFCGADRTGRWSGKGPQPQNLAASGPKVVQCDKTNGCGKHYHARPDLDACPWCQTPSWASEKADWSVDAVEDALQVIETRWLPHVEHYFGDPIAAVSGCLRGLFSAAPGCDLICSDYSAIEAVVLAMLAGEDWRIEVFRTHGKIYEMSLAKITGMSFEDIMAHAGYMDLTVDNWWTAPQTGSHHPLRKKIGKVAELGSGYQGSVGAWKAFGADEYFETDEEIKAQVDAWRKASPNVVKFWYGLQDAAIAAVQNPGQNFQYRGLVYGVRDDVLYCQLWSGRKLAYHKPRLHPDVTPWGRQVLKLTYEGWNSDYKKGPKGWMRLDTYGGKLCENVVQATARDLLAYALKNVEAAGYPVVLHVHDEIVAEVPEGSGSIEEFERIMAAVPPWASDWPVKAAGGWRGKRYRKD
jgi:DNA polymerase bacteriophage-type